MFDVWIAATWLYNIINKISSCFQSNYSFIEIVRVQQHEY